MKKCKRVQHTCDTPTFAGCARYEGTANTQSILFEDDCLSLEETTQDIYNQLEQIDLSDLGTECLTYVLEDGKNVVKNVLLKYETEICALKDRVTELENTAFCSMSIADCGLDFECLQTACETEIVTVKDLFQALITKACLTP